MPNDKIEWQTYEYTHYEKSSDWFWIVGVVTFTAIVLALIFENYLFAIVIAIGSFALMTYAHRKPDLLHYEVNRDGIIAGKTMYPYGTLDSFWIDRQDKNQPTILLKSQKMLAPLIVIPLGDADADMIREFVINYLEEEELEEPLSQKIMEVLGF